MKAKRNKINNLTRRFILVLLFCPVVLLGQQRRVSAFIFQPEWYAGVHTGVNLSVVEGFPSYNWLQSTGLSIRPLVGYQFSPVLGVRGLIGINGHRWNDIRGGNNDSILSFGSQTFQADIMLNLSNLFFGYSLNTPLDFSIYAGAGAIHRNPILALDGSLSYIIRGGAQFDYRISQSLEFNVLTELNITGDNFNAFVGGAPVDLFPAVMVGLTWHFRTKKPFSRRCCD